MKIRSTHTAPQQHKYTKKIVLNSGLVFLARVATLQPMNIQQVVGDNIRHIRHLYKMSLEDLSVYTKMSRTHLQSIETGKSSVGVAKLQIIAKALKVEPHVLLIPNFYKTHKIKPPEAHKKPRASSASKK